jgi:hypothetical protein
MCCQDYLTSHFTIGAIPIIGGMADIGGRPTPKATDALPNDDKEQGLSALAHIIARRILDDRASRKTETKTAKTGPKESDD